MREATALAHLLHAFPGAKVEPAHVPLQLPLPTPTTTPTPTITNKENNND